jgi:hypothetical protein
MALCAKSSHPSHRSYVIKLHRDARGARGELRGRVEHLATGRWFEFVGADELAAGLARDLAAPAGEERGSGLQT